MSKKIILFLLLIFFCLLKPLYAQNDERMRTAILPPFTGQISAYSDFTIPKNSFNELTNCLIDEQGKLVSRPGFYCFKYSVDTNEPILGVYKYKKQIEGGSSSCIIFNINEKLYKTEKYHSATNTDISGGFTFSDDGIPVFDTFYNYCFMVNGENNPVMYDQDTNIIQIGRTTYLGTVTFEDTNEIVTNNSIYFDANDYHFRIGMDLTIANSNNNDGTYEIIDVDSNVIVIKNTDGTAVDLNERTDPNVSLIGLGIPDELTEIRTETVTLLQPYEVFFYPTAVIAFKDFEIAGFKIGMSVTISGSAHNDGTYTLTDITKSGRYSVLWFSGESFTFESPIGITFVGTQTITSSNTFNPSTIAGHKGRLFAGGVKEFSTYLFYSRSRLASQYFYDLWRDRVNMDDGTGYFDMQDKIVALVPNYLDMLLIFCEHSIYYLRGDDPGFDILTPNQTFVFQPVLVTKELGITGPNAWERIGNEVYFYSDEGLQKLSTFINSGELTASLLSLPIKDIHKTMKETGTLKKITMEFLPATNSLYINSISNYETNRNAMFICYNLSNNSFSTWEFDTSSDPTYLFRADISEDPNITDIEYITANPFDTLWFGSEDGKLWSMNENISADYDYEDPNNESINSITTTAITPKYNFDDIFLEKNFMRSIFIITPKTQYDNTLQGNIFFYKKTENQSWSNAIIKYFKRRTDDNFSSINNYYEYFDLGSNIKGQGRTIQYKIETSGTSGRYGFELIGILNEWMPIKY